MEFYLAEGSSLQADAFKNAPDKEFVVLCNLGRQSMLATETMQDMGVKNVKNLVGGYAEWKKKLK